MKHDIPEEFAALKLEGGSNLGDAHYFNEEIFWTIVDKVREVQRTHDVKVLRALGYDEAADVLDASQLVTI